ncbi:VOC family protein [Acidovorax sp. LjRoot66]|uniref:VOC family protein n=1 Tax=Acidovorax sp. LjRoot66 TaxID=3342334 RepID=UPI003F505696
MGSSRSAEATRSCRHRRPKTCWFYVPDAQAWQARCDATRSAGFVEVPSFNPYWNQSGRTFEDPDGYRVVIQCAAWGAPNPA